MRVVAFCSIALLACIAAVAPAGGTPSPKDKCPVCGMFVAKYPDWTASVAFRNGNRYHFDGAKDLFRFYFDLGRYAKGRRAADVAGVTVKDYYSLETIDGGKAFYVLGSDVYGPMGKELIPFASRQDAENFFRDHHGARILTFREIGPSVLKLLE